MRDPSPQATLSRRGLLRLLGGSIVVGLGSLAGCRPDAHPKPSASPHVPPGKDSAAATASRSPLASDVVVARVAGDERALIAAYDDAMSAHPGLASRLAALRADHADHLDGLLPGAAASLAASPAPPPLPGTPTTCCTASTMPGSALTPSGPASSSAALASVTAHLASLEHSAAAARVDDLAASPGSLARVLASIGGCEASHEALLRAMT